MKRNNSYSTAILICLLLVQYSCELKAEDKTLKLTGWGYGEPEKVIPDAAEVGFDEIILWSHDVNYIQPWVEIGKKYSIDIYGSIFLNNISSWKAKKPGKAVPLQEMNERENLALKRIQNDTNKGKSNYQQGGETYQEIEVLTNELLCFHHPEVLNHFKEQIKSCLTIPGIKGIAFDIFGYRNYRRCYCRKSMELFQQYWSQHPDSPYDKALNDFSLQTLVDFNNDMADCTRSINPNITITNHVYPVFLPEPLYGNRLNLDECCQTAAWFFEPFWDYEKIKNYSQIIFGEEKKYYPDSEGAALIGYTEKMLDTYKDPNRVEKELQAIIDSEGDRIHVCVMNEVLDNKQVRNIFKKFFNPAEKKTKANATLPASSTNKPKEK